MTIAVAHRTQVGRPDPPGEAGDRSGEGPNLQALAPVRGRHAQRQQQHQDFGAEVGRSGVDPPEGGEGQALEQQPDDGVRVSASLFFVTLQVLSCGNLAVLVISPSYFAHYSP